MTVGKIKNIYFEVGVARKKTLLLLFIAKFLEIRSLILQAVVRGQPSRTLAYHLSRMLSTGLVLEQG